MRLDPEVREVLETGVLVDGAALTITRQLDRKLYVRVDKALQLMGGQWNRGKRAHVFADPPAEVIADAVATGAVLDFRKEFQFFETPPAIARRLVELAEVEPRMRVLEPSAGRGRIVQALRDAGVEPLVVETEPGNQRHLRAIGARLIGGEFLVPESAYEPFDRIVANPPFSRGQDVVHVTHMYRCLKPGGRLVSVMSPRWTFGKDKRSAAFRALVEANGGRWTLLPEGSFEESGTSVNAGILVMDKPAGGAA